MNTPNKKEFLRIVNAFLNGTASAKQHLFIKLYFDLFSSQPDSLESKSREEINNIKDRMKAKIDETITIAESRGRMNYTLYQYIGIAASLIIISVIGIYFYYPSEKQQKQNINIAAHSDLSPGSDKAILTLSNGKKINLSDAAQLNIKDEDGMIIKKTDDGKLVYQTSDVKSLKTEAIYNTIETPRGGQYQLILPDDTKVWLNSGSSLRYPLAFNGKQRIVDLKGEAYFEVTKNKTKSFKVVTLNQDVTVLGTHFNINAYDNEPLTKTTLLEGSVRVGNTSSSANIMLKPGQAAMLSNNKPISFTLSNVDTDEAVAWQNGYFMFNDEPLESILRKVSRWYDVDIEYTTTAFNRETFSGTISKYSNASQVLRKIELTGSVHFSINGRRIKVMR